MYIVETELICIITNSSHN